MAPTPTTRYGLLKPDPDDLYDVAIHNGNMDKLDAVGGIQIVTSGTRPGTPRVNQAIKESDTGRLMVWDGDSWEELIDPSDFVYTPPTIPPVLIGGKRYDGSSAVLTTMANNANEQLTGMDTGSRAVEANTSYSIKASIDFDSTVVGDRFDFRIRLTDLAGTVLALSNNVQFVTAAVRQTVYLDGLHMQGAAPGSIVAVATIQRRSGTGTGRIYKSTTTRPWIRIERLGLTSLLTQV